MLVSLAIPVRSSLNFSLIRAFKFLFTSTFRMNAGSKTANQWAYAHHGFISVLAPVILVSIGYIDPGKWAACVDTGARFGGDLIAFLLLFNFVASICQYLSAHISVICGKNLAQICRAEFDKPTCIFLVVQAELSMNLLDLTMILGIANGLHMIFGVDLFSSVLLTALNTVLYPVFSALLETSKANTTIICMGGITFISYVLGMLMTQPDIPLSPIILPSKLRGESIYALMSLLGANIMPHNFYLHSSIVQRFQGPPSASKGQWAHNNILIIFVIFSGVFLVNYALMNSAANIFNGTGLVLLTFQDAMSLMEQAFRSRIGSLAFFMLIFSSNQIVNLSWEIGREGGQAMLYDFFEIDLPWWLHCTTIRIFAIIPALYCIWFSGAEGMYQMLIFSQVVMALLLPTSVFPLYRIASCGTLMGVNKISSVTEFLVLLSFMGMVGLKVIFLVEMAFGESDWVDNLSWNMGLGMSAPYVILIVIGCVWLCFTIRLLSTPLKCMQPRPDAQIRNWEIPPDETESYIEEEEDDILEPRYYGEQVSKRPEELPSLNSSIESFSDSPDRNSDIDLPDTIMDVELETHLPTIDERSCIKEPLVSSIDHLDQFTNANPVIGAAYDASDAESLASLGSKEDVPDPVEKTPIIEDEVVIKKNGEGENWEAQESAKRVSKMSPFTGLEGMGHSPSRSLSGKADEGGNVPGSLSRLSGLGRAARRQLAAVLDEFWGQLYDFHGNFTHEAKTKKLNLLLGVESSKHVQPSVKRVESSVANNFSGGVPFQSISGVGADTQMVSSVSYNAQNLQRLPSNSVGSLYGPRKGTRADEMQVLDNFLQGSSGSALESLERWYSRLRLPPSSDGSCYQPATLHGYQFPSYVNRTAMNRFHYPSSQREYSPLKSPSVGPTSSFREPPGFSQSQKKSNGYNSIQSSSTFQNNALSRNMTLQSDRSNTYDPFSPGLAESTVVSEINAKKYHSSPNISGLSLPIRELYASGKYTQWGNNPSMSTGFGSSIAPTTIDQTLHKNITSRIGGVGMGFDEVPSSPSKPCIDSFPSRLNSAPETGSLWYKQPFEQFGVANNVDYSNAFLETVGPLEQRGLSNSGETASSLTMIDVEVKLLLSLRQCILKLLKLEGSEWLFRQNDGADEELIDSVAVRERFIYEAEVRNMKQMTNVNESSYFASVPQCGEGCAWKVDLIASFGVWCIHRILELSLMESRPELWGKYTYVLNRLQGIIELAFFKARSPKSPCFCLEVPDSYQQRLSPVSGGSVLPPAAKLPRGKLTTASMLMELIKDVETAINSRKGKSGTAAGDVAFPKGKENLASVLKRYKRRLTHKPVGVQEGGARKAYGL